MIRVPGGTRGVSRSTRTMSAALSGIALSSGSGMSARSPDVRVREPRGGAQGAQQANRRPAGRRATALRPHARDPPAAADAPARRADPLLPDHIPVALDQQLAAVGAPRMLPAPDPAWEIARVHELEA